MRKKPAIWFRDALEDLHYAFRTFRRDAGFATFAVLIVGLGVGASSTVFSVVNTLLIRPLPFQDPDRLVWVVDHEDASATTDPLTFGGMFFVLTLVAAPAGYLPARRASRIDPM